MDITAFNLVSELKHLIKKAYALYYALIVGSVMHSLVLLTLTMQMNVHKKNDFLHFFRLFMCS